jgi:pimeloyl-ACP methyl ester carboxylesterase
MPSAAGVRGRNLGPREGVQHAMVDLVHELGDTHGRKVSLIGWSLGGVYARQLAKMMPDRVRSVITLGSPVCRQSEGDQRLADL